MTAQNVIARHNLLEGAIGTFKEEKEAYWIVTLLMWLLPTIVVAGAAIDAMLVIAYLKYAHPWKGILAKEKTGPETSKLHKVVQLLRRTFLIIYGIGGKFVFFAPPHRHSLYYRPLPCCNLFIDSRHLDQLQCRE